VSKLEYNEADLCLDGSRLANFVKDEQEPTYVYSRKGILDRLSLFQMTLARSLEQRHQLHYAVKANSHPEIIGMMKQQGLGADVVSFGELKKCLEAGVPATKVIFSGVGKTKEEIRGALHAGIKQINVESVSELRRISDLAAGLNKKATVVLRVNPAVDAKTHPYISTGFHENKFGIDEANVGECLEVLRQSPHLHFAGLSCHIGSQLMEFSALKEALQKLRKMYEALRAQGFALNVFDVGGGVGIDYQASAEADHAVLENYGKVLRQELAGLEAHVQFEPGRFLVARSGVLLTQIQYIKKTPFKNFVIGNAGMHHLVRPALYQAKHRIFPLLRREGEALKADVVGPVCESSDFLGKDREFVGLREGDWLAIAEAGAYGYSMVSLYNSFPLPRETLF
jgi:diaminopimelate decarboxylase